MSYTTDSMYKWGSLPFMGILFLVLVVFLLLLVGTPWFGYGPVYYYYYPRPVVIDRRPITIVNPPPNSGRPVQVEPSPPPTPPGS